MATDTSGQPLCIVSSDNFLDNSLNQSPCDVAAALYAACGSINFKINPLIPNFHYTPGDDSVPTSQCSCTWAVYNTLMGCTACQVVDGITNSVIEWPFFTANCTSSDLSPSAGTWFPPTLTIPNNTRVPYWAQQDPTKWTGTRFNITEAYALASSNQPDATQATTSTSSTASSSASTTPSAHSSSSPPIGAIVGGAVGGVAVLSAVAFLIWFKCLRKPKYDQQGVFGAPLRVRGTGFGDETPSPGSVMKPGQLGMTVQTRPGHHTQISNDSTVVVSETSYVTYPAGQRPMSDVSLANASAQSVSHNAGMSVDMSGMGHEMDFLPRPFIPPTSPDGFVPATSTPTRKGREAARERDEANAPPSSFARRFNPPTYETALEASATSSRPGMSHSHSASDASSRGNASQTELSLSLSGIPTVASFDGHSPSEGVMDSPTTTNMSGGQPPGLGLRLVGANGKRDTDGYFTDRKDRGS